MIIKIFFPNKNIFPYDISILSPNIFKMKAVCHLVAAGDVVEVLQLLQQVVRQLQPVGQHDVALLTNQG